MPQRRRPVPTNARSVSVAPRLVVALVAALGVLAGLPMSGGVAAAQVVPGADLTVGNSDAPGAISQPPPAATTSGSGTSGSATSAATVYTFGRQPLDDVNSWAAQKAACGLTGPQLATMMLAPTYPETGASGNAAPSPMTLSRYDTQAGLYAFGDTATTYQRAFWHPGVGAWAFDSAGGWNMTAAQEISTTTSAQQAAITMSARWCAASTITDPAQRRASVWAPWLGCRNGVCEAFYQAMYDPAGPKVRVDDTVTRTGGMVTRTCRVPGFGDVPCAYVDPAKAEGFSDWRIPSWGRSPVSAPFYVLSLNGYEYRVWLRNDTGYDATITAVEADHQQRPDLAGVDQGRRHVRPHRRPGQLRLDGLAAPGRLLAGQAHRGHQRRRPPRDVRHRAGRQRCTTPGSSRPTAASPPGPRSRGSAV